MRDLVAFVAVASVSLGAGAEGRVGAARTNVNRFKTVPTRDTRGHQNNEHKDMMDWWCTVEHAEQAVCRRARLTAAQRSERAADAAQQMHEPVAAPGEPTLRMVQESYCKGASRRQRPPVPHHTQP